MGPQYANYNGNVTDMVGKSFRAPRFHIGGGLTVVEWVCTDAVYDPDTNRTHAEFDQVVPS